MVLEFGFSEKIKNLLTVSQFAVHVDMLCIKFCVSFTLTLLFHYVLLVQQLVFGLFLNYLYESTCGNID